MTHITLTAPVANSKMQLTDAQQATIKAFLETRNGKAATVKLSVPQSTRSLKANAFYWGAVLTTIAAHTGHSSEDLHSVFKDMLLERKFLKMGSREVELRKSTVDLSPKEFNDYIERIVAWAAQELGVTVPPH